MQPFLRLHGINYMRSDTIYIYRIGELFGNGAVAFAGYECVAFSEIDDVRYGALAELG